MFCLRRRAVLSLRRYNMLHTMSICPSSLGRATYRSGDFVLRRRDSIMAILRTINRARSPVWRSPYYKYCPPWFRLHYDRISMLTIFSNPSDLFSENDPRNQTFLQNR
uniref:Uncharacterized protein n=1 Tax=Cacopsylla melanoneura TaxID=428564 RepID=A0A8D8VQR9_9HEMI